MSWCMLRGVRRTNIYLSEAEQEALDARAAVEGVSRSDIVRGVIDRELNLDEDEEIDAALGDLAGELADRARKLAAGDPDLSAE
jgi:hypothetical protein